MGVGVVEGKEQQWALTPALGLLLVVWPCSFHHCSESATSVLISQRRKVEAQRGEAAGPR